MAGAARRSGARRLPGPRRRRTGSRSASNLPIPDWLFGWAATIVLVASFAALAALWPARGSSSRRGGRCRATSGRLLGSRTVEWICRAIGVALLVLVIAAGYAGGGTPLDNLAPTFILITSGSGSSSLA